MKKLGFITFIGFFFITTARASLVGDSVELSERWPTFNDAYDQLYAVVGDGPEFVRQDVLTVDVGASSVDLTFGQVGFADASDVEGGFNGFALSGLNDSSGKPLIGFKNLVTDSDITSSRIVVGPDFIGFNCSGLDFGGLPNRTLHVELEFGDPSEVPLPASLNVFLSAIAMLFSAKRFRLFRTRAK